MKTKLILKLSKIEGTPYRRLKKVIKHLPWPSRAKVYKQIKELLVHEKRS